MFFSREDLGDHNPFHPTADFLNPFHLQTEHGQALGQFVYGPIKVDVLFEPLNCYFHRRPSDFIELHPNEDKAKEKE